MDDLYYNHFAEIAKKLPKVASQIRRKTAFDIEAEAKRDAPRDTGFMASTVYVSDGESSDYDKVEGSGPMLPEVKPNNDQETVVGVAADYSVYVNYGTYKMPARPFFTQAVEANRAKFIDAMKQLENKLKAS